MAGTIACGRRVRKDFSKIPSIVEIPNLIEIQQQSYEQFLQKDVAPERRDTIGLQAVFKSVFPIADYNGNAALEFHSYHFGDPKYTVEECHDRGMTFAIPLKVTLRLKVVDNDKETKTQTVREVREQEVYLGELPLMTEKGTFIINGTERVVVSQLQRSAGVFFDDDKGKTVASGKLLHSARVIPYRGSWVEFEFDANETLYVRVDRRRKMLATAFLRSFWFLEKNVVLSDEQVLGQFYDPEEMWFEYVVTSEELSPALNGKRLAEDVRLPRQKDVLAAAGAGLTSELIQRLREAGIEKVRVETPVLWAKLSPRAHAGSRAVEDIRLPGQKDAVVRAGGILTPRLIERLREGGVDKIQVKPETLAGRRALGRIVDTETGEILVESNDEISSVVVAQMLARRVAPFTLIALVAGETDLSISDTLKKDHFKNPDEALVEIYRRLRPGDPPTVDSARALFRGMFMDPRRYDLAKVGRFMINKKLEINANLNIKALRSEDVVDVVRHLLKVKLGSRLTDDIDHLGNRRVRSVGELLENQFRVGLTRMERAVKERMSISDITNLMPHDLINAKPVSAVVKEFFGSSQLSQFMDQTNPLAELTHKRRLSALGPRGLSRERAGFEVRDVHPTHYGRICPIETPEGPNIGLISSLSTYARINEFGFIETPYRIVKRIVVIPADSILTKENVKSDLPWAEAGELSIWIPTMLANLSPALEGTSAVEDIPLPGREEIAVPRGEKLTAESIRRLLAEGVRKIRIAPELWAGGGGLDREMSRAVEYVARELPVSSATENMLPIVSCTPGMKVASEVSIARRKERDRVIAAGTVLTGDLVEELRSARVETIPILIPAVWVNLTPDLDGARAIEDIPLPGKKEIAIRRGDELTAESIRKLLDAGVGKIKIAPELWVAHEVWDKQKSAVRDVASSEAMPGMKIAKDVWTQFRVVTKEPPKFLTALEEEKYVIGQANAELDARGRFVHDYVPARKSGEYKTISPEEVDYMDVSPKQLVSVAAAMVPFLENDDANRALMGANMQRQAVPLLQPEAPLVGTGMEHIVARDSGAVVVARRPGVVEYVSANRVVVRAEMRSKKTDPVHDLPLDIYNLTKYRRSNQNTCINQRPITRKGDRVKAGDVVADGPATDQGELALGRNVLVAFMPWGGYNFEDAILVSERLVKDDRYTSIHIEEFEVQARDTKLGKEEVTRDIPNVSEEALKDLDESGIVRIGAKVKAGDILVGKITPKGETQLTPEEKLLRAIFGEKAGDVRDTSLTVPPGIEGTVVAVRVFSRRGVDKDERAKSIEEEEVAELESEYRDEQEMVEKERDQKLKNLLVGKTLAQDLVDPKLKERLARKGDKIDRPDLDKDFSWNDLKKIRIKEDDGLAETIKKIEDLADDQTNLLDRMLEERVGRLRRGDDLPPGVIKMVKVYVAVKRKLSVGDKMAGRHGNKGVVSRILPDEDMPYLPDGTPVEIVLNPLGVPSRMNVGQILETHLGWAAKALGLWVASPVFDGATEEEITALLAQAMLPTSGKTQLYDGRTGKPFHQQVTVGQIYMLKLAHLVDDKMHARSIGPYSLVTQQPLGGKAQFGGQRFGEMEVWALEAYGAAYTLQEMLTVKSDDVEGRNRIYEAIVKGENFLEPGTPESFNVLVKELQSLALDVELVPKDGKKPS